MSERLEDGKCFQSGRLIGRKDGLSSRRQKDPKMESPAGS